MKSFSAVAVFSLMFVAGAQASEIQSVSDSISLLDLGKSTQLSILKPITLKMTEGQNGQASIEDDVWFQGGVAIYRMEEIDTTQALCQLDTNPKKSTSQEIVIPAKTTATITQSQGRLTENESGKRFYVNLWLSKSQKLLGHLSCEAPQNELREPSVADFRKAVGSYFDLISTQK